MNIFLHLVNCTGDLDIFVEDIEHNFTTAIAKITVKIPVSNVDVVIANNSQGAIPETGIGGKTMNPHLIFVSIDSKFPDLKDSLSKRLERTLAHELHHCIRWNSVGYGKTLLEALITDGLADHFVMEVAGGQANLWDTALTDEQIDKYLEKAKIEFNHEKYNHQAWFFGKGNTDIPRWTGYSLGFYLVKEYLKKHPDKKSSQLYNVKAEKFL